MTIILTPGLRKLLLAAHMIFSIGWLSAVVVFVAHSIVGITSADRQIITAAYIAMWLSCWLVIVPANIGSLLTGIVQAFFTPWGLIKHWWIVVKLILTIGCTILLLLHTNQISYLAQTAAQSVLTNPELVGLRMEIMVKAAAAVIVLIAITAISVYKPWGLTPYGTSKLRQLPQAGVGGKPIAGKTKVLLCVLVALVLLVMLFFIHRHFGGSMHH